MRIPLCAGVMCQRPMSTGSANASDRALNASKNVALPTMTRAFVCHRENGRFSRRAIKLAASTSACSITRCSQCFDVFCRRYRNRPRVVAVQPRRIIVSAFHPCVRAGDRLNPRCAWFAFRRYEAHRKPRTSRIQAISSANTWMKGGDNDPTWLYGYDAWTVPVTPTEYVETL